MTQKNVTRLVLAKQMSEKLNIPVSEMKLFIDNFVECMQDSIIEHNGCKIYGFGKFLVSKKSARVGRNPNTGEEYPISARKVVKFYPSISFKRTLTISTGTSES